MSPHASTDQDCSRSSSAHDWLNYLKHEPQDASWLLQYERNIFDAIQAGLSRNDLFHNAVELLMLVFPFYALICGHVRYWSPLLFDALADAQTLRDSAMQIQILTRLGESYSVVGKQAEAQNAFALAIERASEKQTDDVLLAAYMGLARLQAFHLNQNFDAGVLDKIAGLSRRVTDRNLRAMAHQMLAAGYNAIGEETEALGYAQTAYAYWHQQKHDLNIGQTAFVMAVIQRKLRRFGLAERYLMISQQAFARTTYSRQYGLSAYEEGVHNLKQGYHDTAEQWFSLSLKEFVALDSPYDVAMAHHALGLAQTALKQFNDARQHLRQAVEAWAQIHNQFELASACQALAYLEGVAGNPALALEWVDRASAECNQLPATIKKRLRLQQDIDETRREILANDFSGL